jgi:arsenate reductase (thioredoxin)
MDTGIRSTSPVVIAFVCLHGSAKSLIAAEYLNRLAAQRGLAANLAAAHRVIAFGCELRAGPLHSPPVEQWADCPAVSEGFEPAWRYITTRIDRILEATS